MSEVPDCPSCGRPFLPFWEDPRGRVNTCGGCGWQGFIPQESEPPGTKSVDAPTDVRAGGLLPITEAEWNERWHAHYQAQGT